MGAKEVPVCAEVQKMVEGPRWSTPEPSPSFRADPDPVDLARNATGAGLVTETSDANNSVELAPTDSAHAVFDAKAPDRTGVIVMRAFVDKDSHAPSFLLDRSRGWSLASIHWHTTPVPSDCKVHR